MKILCMCDKTDPVKMRSDPSIDGFVCDLCGNMIIHETIEFITPALKREKCNSVYMYKQKNDILIEK